MANSSTVHSRGSGLGEILAPDEGRRRLREFVTRRPVQAWAGPCTAAGDLQRTLGISRSTVREWWRECRVIVMSDGNGALVCPLEQFVEAVPISGIQAVLEVAPDSRSAWLWLRQPHPGLDGRRPLDVLKAGDTGAVAAAAARDFVREVLGG